jgi:hypothetical protein
MKKRDYFIRRILKDISDDLTNLSALFTDDDAPPSPPPDPVFATSVTQGSVTFNFSKPVQVGQYWNGDWWAVQDPTATITSVTPNSVDSAGRILHGMMKNPFQGEQYGTTQGFDSAPLSGSLVGTIPYSAVFNIDPNIHSNPTTPLTEGSYVKSQSLTNIATSQTRIQNYTVLTVVPTAPAVNSFRPGIRSSSKILNKTTNDVNWGLRRNIPGFTPVADLTAGIAPIKRLQWTWGAMQASQWGYFPSDGSEVYGADWGDNLATRMLAFHGEYSQSQLEETIYSIIQIGIDLISSAQDGLEWVMEEGHHIYRKFPALMAALLLDDAAWKDAVNWNLSPKAFGNDDNAHYYVTQSIIDNSPYPTLVTFPYPYSQEHLGMPEWGAAIEDPNGGIASADLRAPYRVLNGLRHIQGVAWVHGTSGATELCNPAMLDYHDRIAEILAGHYTSSLYSTQLDPPFTGNWTSTPFGVTRLSQYNTLRAFSTRPVFVNVPEEMSAPTLTANVGGTVSVAQNATNAFLSPRALTSAISSYQLRWRPLTNLVGTTTPDASVPWQVITGIPSLPYTLSGVPGNTEIRVQLRAVNAKGTGIWIDDSPQWITGTVVDRYAARVTTHNTASAPQNVKVPVIQLAVLGQNEVARCDPGIWVGNPTPTITYQWKRNGSNISGATSQTYTTGAADIGTTLTCDVAATNASGTTTLTTGGRSISATPATTYTPTINAALFTPIWHYGARVIEGSGFVYGQSGSGFVSGEDSALRLNEVSGANFGNAADVSVLMDFELSDTNNTRAFVILRGAGDNNQQGYILGYTRDSSAASTDLIIDRLASGVRTRLATLDIGGAGLLANTRYSLRVEADGTNLRARYWLTSGAEPGTWSLTATDATYSSGFIGVFNPENTRTRIYRFDVTPKAAPAPTGITLVGGAWATADLPSTAGTQAVNFAGTAAENDLVIILRGADDLLNGRGTSGATLIADEGGASEPGFIFEYVWLGPSPGTSVNVAKITTKRTACLVGLFRGVNRTTPLDVAVQIGATANVTTRTPPSVTTVTNNAMVVAVMVLDDKNPITVSSYPSGYTNTASVTCNDTDTASTTVAAATKIVATAGTESPSAYVVDRSDFMQAITIVLRPA